MANRSRRKHVSSKPFLMLLLLAVMMLTGLGFFRFNAAQLELRLSGVERRITRYTAEEAELRHILSALTSPIKIHSFSREQMGMIPSTQQEIINIPRARTAAISQPQPQLQSEPQARWRDSMSAFFGFAAN